MPKIKAILALEFEADGSDQRSIDAALDQVLVLQPSCKVVSKVITEVDRKAVNADGVFQPDVLLGAPNHVLLGQENGVHSGSYGAEFFERNSDHHGMDSYKTGRLNSHSHRAVDCYRQKGKVLSDPAGACQGRGPPLCLSWLPSIHLLTEKEVFPPLSDKPKDPPDWLDSAQQAGQLDNGQILPTTYGPEVGSDARDEQLTQDTVFRPQLRYSAPAYGFNHDLGSDDYSPPPASRSDRSASPSGEGLRRSVRLRAAASNNKDDVRSGERRPQEPQSDLRRRTRSSDEKDESRLQTHSRRRLKGLKRTEAAEPDSLEELACKSVMTKKSQGERKKFERQQERS